MLLRQPDVAQPREQPLDASGCGRLYFETAPYHSYTAAFSHLPHAFFGRLDIVGFVAKDRNQSVLYCMRYRPGKEME